MTVADLIKKWQANKTQSNREELSKALAVFHDSPFRIHFDGHYWSGYYNGPNLGWALGILPVRQNVVDASTLEVQRPQNVIEGSINEDSSAG